MFPYPCPSCSQRLLAPTERAGQRTICPKCLRPLTIPQPESGMQDPNTLVDPSEAPLPIPVLADTNTPFPGEIPLPNFARVEVSAATAVVAPAPVQLRAAHSVDLTFELPEIPLQDRSGVSDTSYPRPSVTATPMPVPVKTRRTLNRDAQGMVMLNPTGLFSVDMTAELTAAISMRMKPPPEQSVDRRLVLGAWAFGTLAALGLWVAGLFYNPECLPFVALLGGAMLLFGLCWRAYLVGQEESTLSGLLCLFPPVSLYRLFQKSGDNGHRPLRFAASGAVVLGLLAASATARSWVETSGRRSATESVSNLDKLQAAKENPAKLQEVLKELATADAAKASVGDNRAATISEMKKLLAHEQTPVRIASALALLEWSPADAKAWLLAALKSKETGVCHAAFTVAAKSRDAEVAGAVASKFADRDHRVAASRCLLAVGKPAEPAVIELLDSPSEVVVLSAIDVLSQIGGTKSFAALLRLANKTKSDSVKAEAEHASQRLSAGFDK